MMLPRVLALDIATLVGVTVDVRGSDKPLILSFDCGRDHGELGRAFTVYERKIGELIREHLPDVIAYESPVEQRRGDPALNSQTTAMKLLGLVAVTQMVGFKLRLRLMPCHLQEVRRHFAGNGHATKQEVYDRCVLLGWRPKTLDESDSAAVWDYCKGRLKAQLLGAA